MKTLRPLLLLLVVALLLQSHSPAQTPSTTANAITGLTPGFWLIRVDAAGRIVDADPTPVFVVGDVPNGPTVPPPPPPPRDPPTETFGLAEFASTTVTEQVAAYDGRDADQLQVAAGFDAVIDLMGPGGAVTSIEQGKAALNFTLNSILRRSRSSRRWQNWRDVVRDKLDGMADLDTLDKYKQSLQEISFGLTSGPASAAAEQMAVTEDRALRMTAKQVLGSPAFGDGNFLAFLERLLPLILAFLKIFGGIGI